MKNFKVILILLSVFVSHLVFATPQCSKKGARLFYVNGINVNSVQAYSTSRLINQRLLNVSNQLDKTKYFPPETVHNISTGFIEDIRETKSMLLGNRSGVSREEFYETMLRGEFGLPMVRMETSYRFKSVQEKAYDKARDALRQHLKKYQIKDEDDYRRLASIKSESDLLQAMGKLLVEEKRLENMAAADVLVVNKVIFKIAEALKSDYKVLFVAHSQGNEVLKSAVRELQREPVGKGRFDSVEQYEKTMKRVLGTLQIAPPSSDLAFCDYDNTEACKSRKIKLDEDLVIDTGNFVMSFILRSLDYQTPSVSPNYKLYEDPFVNIFDMATMVINPLNVGKKLLFLSETQGIHGMDTVYLSDEIKGVPIGGGSEKAMSQIFRENAIEVAETLSDNCERECRYEQATFVFDYLGSNDGTLDGVVAYCGDKSCRDRELSLQICADESSFGCHSPMFGFEHNSKSKFLLVQRYPDFMQVPVQKKIQICEKIDLSDVVEPVTISGVQNANQVLESESGWLAADIGLGGWLDKSED